MSKQRRAVSQEGSLCVRDATDGKGLLVALLHESEVGRSVFVGCGIFAFQPFV